MQGTSISICPRACLILAICPSRKTGSTTPSHSSVSILYGTRPRCQRAGALRNAFRAVLDPGRFPCSAMSPSSRLGSEWPGLGANSPRREGRKAAHVTNRRYKCKRIVLIASLNHTHFCPICLAARPSLSCFQAVRKHQILRLFL